MSDPLLSLGFGGDSNAASRLEGFVATAEMARLMALYGPIIRDSIRDAAPYRDSDDSDGQSLHLRDSIEYAGAEVSFGGVTASWTSSAPWASFVVEGTQPHEIHAVVAKALHWQGPDGDAFAQSVQHPGTKPNPFAWTGFERVQVELLAAFAELFEEL